ncbi:hypothetical protein J416_12654 [Gracilibacillus halophilus YIM-C55.5]|uniref:Lipoprotein n=1 Tax=Gracilibacillus halophilus YIM-C55.5 TaxID=1308866 RepID=N4W9X2_9BACI|nr:hypothetical protein [Gracilibacillus halophilus]ENH96054.1 hypothetical protein J416_12654 [Gracilibacillus halophilus YIM-C55.5]
MFVKKMFTVLAFFIILALIGCSNVEGSSKIYNNLESDEIAQLRMTMMIMADGYYNEEDITFTQDEINKFLDLYNAVPEERIIEIKQVPSELKTGIVIDLKQETEIRIQYDGDKIYNTIIDVTGQQKYVIHFPELTSFFERKVAENI